MSIKQVFRSIKFKGVVQLTICLLTTQSIFAQLDRQLPFTQQLKVEVIDVVDRNDLTGVELVLLHEKDTLYNQLTTATSQRIELKNSGVYTAKVMKKRYDTLTCELTIPTDSAEFILEFFMPKTTLTWKEKRKAHFASRHLPERPCKNCGGFKRIVVGYNEMCVMRFLIYTQNESYSSSYEFRKLTYY